MYKKIFIAIVLLFFSPLVLAQAQKTMDQMAVTLAETYVLVFDEKIDPPPKEAKEEFTVQQKIKNLAILFDQAKPHLTQRGLSYRLSTEIFAQQLAKQANFDILDQNTKKLLNSLLNSCATCHAQDKIEKDNQAFSQKLNRKFFQSDWQYAEFNYAIRNYTLAKHYYEKIIFNKSQQTIYPQEYYLHAISKILFMDLQKKRDFILAKQHLKQYLTAPVLENSTKKIIEEWIKGLNEFSPKYAQFSKYMQKHYKKLEQDKTPLSLEAKERVFYILMQSGLYEYLNTNPKENEIPMLLYWLALCNQKLTDLLDNNPSEFYLQECMLKYPQHPYAKKCYLAYEEYMQFNYNGSLGDGLPEELATELKSWKARVEPSGE